MRTRGRGLGEPGGTASGKESVLETPVPSGRPDRRPEADDERRIIIAMAAESPPKLQIPRWIQLVTLPLLLLLIWAVAGAVRHVIFLFLLPGLIALVLHPPVRCPTGNWLPPRLGVAIVHL